MYGLSQDNLLEAGVFPFYLTGDNDRSVPLIRGRLARLFSPCESILMRHNYPHSVAELSAEAMALAACLSTTLTFDGVFTLQAKGDGAVRTLFADVTSTGHLRAYVAFSEQEIKKLPAKKTITLPTFMQSGYMAFSVTQNVSNNSESHDDSHHYQGIVELAGNTLGECANRWFRDSQQLATQTITAASKSETGWHGAALFLQQIGDEGGIKDTAKITDLYAQKEQPEYWHNAMIMMASVKRSELFDRDLSSIDLLYRLFHDQGLHIQPATEIIDQCRCSDQKIKLMLTAIDADERAKLVDEQGQFVVDCQFCKTERIYQASDFSPPPL